MTPMIEDVIKLLRRQTKLENSIDVERFEATLHQIAQLRDPRSIGLLIPFFDDDCQFPEVMFSIIHIIESFDHEVYVKEILRSLPSFWQRSPYWASVAHVAILNTPAVLDSYANQLKQAPDSIREQSVVDENP